MLAMENGPSKVRAAEGPPIAPQPSSPKLAMSVASKGAGSRMLGTDHLSVFMHSVARLTRRSRRSLCSLCSLGRSALRTCLGMATPLLPEQALHAERRLPGR